MTPRRHVGGSVGSSRRGSDGQCVGWRHTAHQPHGPPTTRASSVTFTMPCGAYSPPDLSAPPLDGTLISWLSASTVSFYLRITRPIDGRWNKELIRRICRGAALAKQTLLQYLYRLYPSSLHNDDSRGHRQRCRRGTGIQKMLQIVPSNGRGTSVTT